LTIPRLICLGLKPEVYFKPQEVWEIRGAEYICLFLDFRLSLIVYCSITLSPVSVAAKGLVSGSRGLSLRFPRFLRVYHDKVIEQASTPHFLVDMWKTQQAQGQVKGGNDEGDLIDADMNDSEAEELSD
jgi:DNA ligase 1